METLTQEQLDESIIQFKIMVHCISMQYPSISIAFIKEEEMRDTMLEYETEIRPLMLELGLDSPSLKELFGIELTVTENTTIH